MTETNARENALAEIARGDEALAEANVLLENGLCNGAVSRAYYSVYHWARALLFVQGVEARSHRGMIQLVNLHFVKPGKLPRKTGQLLAQLETSRELSDYRAAATFSADEAREAIVDAGLFIAGCRPLIPWLHEGE